MTTTFNDELGTDALSLALPKSRRSLLRRYAGRRISETEERKLFSQIADHKWHMSERLHRDVGFNVAAVDYFENFHEPTFEANAGSATHTLSKRLRRHATNVARYYFESKGRNLTE